MRIVEDTERTISIYVPPPDRYIEGPYGAEPVYRFDIPRAGEAFSAYWNRAHWDPGWMESLANEETDLLVELCPRLAHELAKALTVQNPAPDNGIRITDEDVSFSDSLLTDNLNCALKEYKRYPVVVPMSPREVIPIDHPEVSGWGTPQALQLFLISVAAYSGGDPFTFVRHVLLILVCLRIGARPFYKPGSLLRRFLAHVSQNFLLRYTLFDHVLDRAARCPSEVRTVAIWFLSRCPMLAPEADFFVGRLLDFLRLETDQTDPIMKWPDGEFACVRLAALKTLRACVGPRDNTIAGRHDFVDHFRGSRSDGTIARYVGPRDKIVAALLDFVDRFGGSRSDGTIARDAVYVLKYYYGVDARSRYIQRLFSTYDREIIHSLEYEEALLDMQLASTKDYETCDWSELFVAHAKLVKVGLKEDRLRTQRGLPALIEAGDVDGLAAVFLNFGPVKSHAAALPHLFDILYWSGMPEGTRAELRRACRALDTTADPEALDLKHAIFDCLGRGRGPDDILDLLGKSEWFMRFLKSGASQVLRANLKYKPRPYQVEDLALSALTGLRPHAYRDAFRLRPNEHWKFISLLTTLRKRALAFDYDEMSRGSRAVGSPKDGGKQLTSADVAAEDFRQAFEPPGAADNESCQYRVIAAKDDVAKLMESVEARLGSTARRVLEVMYEGFLVTGHGYTKTEIGKRLEMSREVPYRVLMQIQEMFQSEFGENS
jgi:hypothetical protein